MFQEVMFVSLKYAILAPPGLIVSTPSRTSQDNFRRLNRLRTWPGTPDLAIWVLGVGRQQLAYRESETHARYNPPDHHRGADALGRNADKLPIAIPPRTFDTFNGRLRGCRGRWAATARFE
jgi:hypothetical protein